MRACMRPWARLAATAAVTLICGALTAAQAPVSVPAPPSPLPGQDTRPARPRPRRPNMQAMTEALGVTCAYCHVADSGREGALDFKSEANPKKRAARLMVAMTADINAGIPAAVLKSPEDSTLVTCATCHRGVPDPRPLAALLIRVAELEGLDEAIARYRDLRARYFGRDAYDFSERTLLVVGQTFVERAPEGVLALMQVNLEFHPASADSYVMMAQAETRRFDDRAAIPYLEKALAINPDHALAQGYLVQLRQFTKPRP